MKWPLFLLLAIICASCSPRPDSKSVEQWTKVLAAKKAALEQADTAAIRQLLMETDLQLSGFRSGQFHDTLSLAEGQLIDSVLMEKHFLEQSLANLRATIYQLDMESKELAALKQAIDKQEGTVSERNKLVSTVEKDTRAVSGYAEELLTSILRNRQQLLEHSEQLKEIVGKYFIQSNNTFVR